MIEAFISQHFFLWAGILANATTLVEIMLGAVRGMRCAPSTPISLDLFLTLGFSRPKVNIGLLPAA